MASFWEHIQVDGSSLDVYVSVPDGLGPFPAVVISHHGGGVDQFIQETTDRLSGEGYVVAAPNFFHRITDAMLADGSRRIQHLQDRLLVQDIDATVGFLRGHPSVQGQPIGVTGFCLGGRTTFLAAASTRHFQAAVPYYGGNLKVPFGDAEKPPFQLADEINCPVLFHFGAVDTNPSQGDMAELDAELTRLGVDHQFHTYQGADHAFMDYTAARYNTAAAELSWPRTLEFFAAHLKTGTKQ